MTQQNAPVLDRHRDEAAQAAGFIDWNEASRCWSPEGEGIKSIRAHAQDKANNEALNNRLAEIDRIAEAERWYSAAAGKGKRQVAALASGHTPSPCPGCAAKDEAMEAFKADVSEVVTELLSWPSHDTPFLRSRLERFIIPPADPLAEALKSILTSFGEADPASDPYFPRALTELKARLPELMAAKGEG